MKEILENSENKELLTTFTININGNLIYIMAITLLFRYSQQEQELPPFVKDIIIKEGGRRFIEKVYNLLEDSNLKSFKTNLTESQIKNCDCFYDDLCYNEKLSHLNEIIQDLVNNHDISITQIIRCVESNLLPTTMTLEEAKELFKIEL